MQWLTCFRPSGPVRSGHHSVQAIEQRDAGFRHSTPDRGIWQSAVFPQRSPIHNPGASGITMGMAVVGWLAGWLAGLAGWLAGLAGALATSWLATGWVAGAAGRTGAAAATGVEGAGEGGLVVAPA